MTEELYKKYRPTKLGDVVGQDTVINTLRGFGKQGKVPHTILLTGDSGVGKTTIARILRKLLKCADIDFTEINSANNTGIDTVRGIQERVNAAPLAGKTRVWLLDELHQMSTPAQEAMLKLLEDTPEHCYFLLATTNPEKLKRTIITRSTVLKCVSIPDADIKGLVQDICEKEKITLTDTVLKELTSAADGSARQALVSLNSIATLGTESEQLQAIVASDTKAQAIKIARLLFNQKTSWAAMAKTLKAVLDEGQKPESLRHMILGYCSSILLSGKDAVQAAMIIEEFRDNFYDSNKAGLVISCHNIISENIRK